MWQPYGWWDRTRLNIVTAPTKEPITLTRAKQHLRVDVGDDDDYISSLITVARQSVEQYCRRTLYKQTWKYTLQSFRDLIDIPMAPCLSVTSITYVDLNNVVQTLSSSVYRVVTGDGGPGGDSASISLGYQQVWPSVLGVEAAVNITFYSGYTDGATNPIVTYGQTSIEGDPLGLIPAPIKHAILLWIGTLYENRESVVVGTISSELPNGVAALLAPNRRLRF